MSRNLAFNVKMLQVMALNSSLTSHVASHPRLLHMDEPRASRAALARAHARLATSTDILTAINIGRAASVINFFFFNPLIAFHKSIFTSFIIFPPSLYTSR